ncbi:glycerol dehydratase reactivase beta/small subunit family protein [Loigolactobacillus rennini]|uniref:Propanediol dehydratase reactivation protein PduH n=2 Tax=Loigolactobacillus rennini TaxID=238013 RepID=A0A0R2D128_9LACO|nr:glycerol dehydratase reactivase beta/small subunit family protein [Loigolactobacillus rennini]KRM97671.1 propanediol dehydratase reactivation protein PduH [Loigolactobacillus rennini DSM 20253]SFZ88583.1 Propanediol dehydratase reactivation factor small subunit [Loigolactobacillus rennini]
MTVKPVILIASGFSDQRLQPLLYGIEEEQIPYAVRTIDRTGTLAHIAHEAAIASPLSVGIAYDQQHIDVHYKNLPEDQPLFSETWGDVRKLRALGANAARLVKGVPFKVIKEETRNE